MEIIDNTEATLPQPSQAATVRRVTLFEQINLNLFWFANNFHWQALLAIVLPSMVVKYLGEANKDINLTLVVSWGTLVAVVVNPLVGALSDYTTLRLGRRRPYMIFGTVLNVLVLIGFAFSPGWFPNAALLGIFIFLFILLQFSNNLANSPWSAIIADKVPKAQRGFSSGFCGLFTLLGLIGGSLTAGVLLNKKDALPLYNNEIIRIFLLIAALQIIVVAYTVLTVKETPLPAEARFSLRESVRDLIFKPTRYPDFSWVLLARLLVMMGVWGVFYFLQYYFDDVLHVSGEQFSGALFLPIMLATAMPTSILAGWASDRWGRKSLVYLSGINMTLACLFFIFFQNPTGALIAGAFFGIGYGAYTSVDWALATDALPPTDEAGKFMGLWSAFGILPQVIGIAVGGVMLQLAHGLPNHFGYTLLFLLTIFYFAIGTVVIRQIKGVR